MSALPPKADIVESEGQVCFMPNADSWLTENVKLRFGDRKYGSDAFELQRMANSA
jgi:hypothetical protein